MRKSVSFETVGVLYETVGIGMKQGELQRSLHEKCPEEYRAFANCVRFFCPRIIAMRLVMGIIYPIGKKLSCYLIKL